MAEQDRGANAATEQRDSMEGGMSAQEQRLRQTFEQMRRDGLVDLKFVFGPLQERTKEDVYGSVNTVLDAIASGEFVEFPTLGDSYGRKPA